MFRIAEVDVGNPGKCLSRLLNIGCIMYALSLQVNDAPENNPAAVKLLP